MIRLNFIRRDLADKPPAYRRESNAQLLSERLLRDFIFKPVKF